MRAGDSSALSFGQTIVLAFLPEASQGLASGGALRRSLYGRAPRCARVGPLRARYSLGQSRKRGSHFVMLCITLVSVQLACAIVLLRFACSPSRPSRRGAVVILNSADRLRN